jgi:hypothetical protein
MTPRQHCDTPASLRRAPQRLHAPGVRGADVVTVASLDHAKASLACQGLRDIAINTLSRVIGMAHITFQKREEEKEKKEKKEKKERKKERKPK